MTLQLQLLATPVSSLSRRTACSPCLCETPRHAPHSELEATAGPVWGSIGTPQKQPTAWSTSWIEKAAMLLGSSGLRRGVQQMVLQLQKRSLEAGS